MGFFCFESKRNMKTFILIVACIGLLIGVGCTTSCNSGGIGTKCWIGGVGPIGSCDNGLICYNGYYNGNSLFQDGYCIADPTLTCSSAGTKCWTGGVGPIGNFMCCDGLICYNGNNPSHDGYCLAVEY